MLNACSGCGIHNVFMLLYTDLTDGDSRHNVDAVAACKCLCPLLHRIIVGLTHLNAKTFPALTLYRIKPVQKRVSENQIRWRDFFQHKLSCAATQLSIASSYNITYHFLLSCHVVYVIFYLLAFAV